MTDSTDAPDREELRTIVRQELARMASNAQPSRRDVLAAGAGSITATALLAGLSEPARGAAAGQGNLGTSTEPWQTVYATHIENPTSNPLTTPAIEADAADTRQGYTRVEGSRNLDNWYQNTTGADLDVHVSANADADATKVDIKMDVSVDQTQNAIENQRVTIDSSDRISIHATVPDQYYYQVRTAGDTADYRIKQWAEQQ